MTIPRLGISLQRARLERAAIRNNVKKMSREQLVQAIETAEAGNRAYFLTKENAFAAETVFKAAGKQDILPSIVV